MKQKPLDPETMAPHQVVALLGKLLSEAGASFGVGPSRVWDDWLSYCVVALETGIGPFRDGQLPSDFTPIQAEVDRLRSRYDASHGNFDRLLNNFREAFAVWYGFSSVQLYDVLGETFMVHMLPNKDAGQVFTPWSVATMMAQINIADGARLVFDRIREAVERLRAADEVAALYCDSVILTGAAALAATNSPAVFQSLLVNILPLIKEHYEPITICDPACGSGNLLLAASGCFPRFAVRLGLVQFYGNDIAHVCVQMAHLNEMAYGLNGYGAAAVWHDLMSEGAAAGAAAAGAGDDSAQEPTAAAEPLPAAAALPLPDKESREDSMPKVAAAVIKPRRKTMRTQAEEDAEQMAFNFFQDAEQGVTQ